MEEPNKITNTSSHLDAGPMFISVKEAVKITGIGRNMMLEFAKMKGFPAIIKPHKIYIDIKELPVWLRKQYGRYKS